MSAGHHWILKYSLAIEATNGFFGIFFVLKNNKSKAGSAVGLPDFYERPKLLKRLL